MITVRELNVLTIAMNGNGCAVRVELIAYQRYLLIIGLGSRGLDAELGEKIRDVFCRRIVTGVAGAASFARIVGQPLEVRTQRRLVKREFLVPSAAWHVLAATAACE
jgi:hypothetical protein